MTTSATQSRSGMVALVGRPNVGKSTLVNALVGEKVSIVTPKPQTTRHRIIGVLTQDAVQIALVDTPGLHTTQKSALNRVMNETAVSSLAGIDAVLFVVEAGQWHEDDELALSRLARVSCPVGLVVNKTDRVRDKAELLPFMARMGERRAFDFVVPLSARRSDNLGPLLDELTPRMPAGPYLFPEDEYTDRNMRFLAAEAVREKLMLFLQQELPYSIAIEIEAFETTNEQIVIHACIWVARDNHKSIVIGRGGAMLKKIGRAARLDLVERLGQRVDLRLWVKVRDGWTDSEAAVRDLGH
ncbi:GTPase Era [Salinisphaera sp. Q1T1-3]|uniref:GTPase Era n=1 Tax=Salinisphaera sp. Q1T1-3 TaxID=2321229 RepID=UPI000E758D58|nr:GTPase Era [Salinisphaera sp. Q1T1-3]RJS92049.1 GTPase Era [Salinisphaera sp. Q1T1-3]